MPGSGAVIAIAAILCVAAGASILLAICVVHQMRKKAKKQQHAPARIRSSTSHISIIWPSMTEKLEGSISKNIKAGSNGMRVPSDLLDTSIKQSSKVASIWRNTYPIKAFRWVDQPHLVAEAVEHGWSTFAFTFANMDAPIPTKLWESCNRFSYLPDKLAQPELAWEVSGTSSDYIQKIRLNPSLLNPAKRELYLDGLLSTVQSLQTTLPLPGPPLGPLSFPQEGYYEITVFGSDAGFAELSQSDFNENEYAHLIAPRSSSLRRSHASYDTSSALGGGSEVQQKKPASISDVHVDFNGKKEGLNSVENPMQVSVICTAPSVRDHETIDTPALQSAANEQQICAIGLAAGLAPPFRLPGSDTASIGFFSNGRIFINGSEQKKPEGWQRRIWGPATAMPVIVGCGFDPSARRLFFTLNGEIVEELKLPALASSAQVNAADGDVQSTEKSMDFTASPLFPTIGANYSVTVMANFGQAAFAYEAANTQRVPDPCFRRPQMGQKAAGEDSADLFSMGKIDSEWLADTGVPMPAFTSPGRVNGRRQLGLPPPSSSATSSPVLPHLTSGYVQGESDLFEITLESRTF